MWMYWTVQLLLQIWQVSLLGRPRMKPDEVAVAKCVRIIGFGALDCLRTEAVFTWTDDDTHNHSQSTYLPTHG